MSSQLQKPSSSVSGWTGLLGLAAACVLFFLFPGDLLSGLSSAEQSVVFLMAVFFVMAAFELCFIRPYRAPEAGLNFSKTLSLGLLTRQAVTDFETKLLGLLATLGIAVLFFWVADIYGGRWYGRFFELLLEYRYALVAVLFCYFLFIHLYMEEVKDDYWHFGVWFLTLGRSGNRHIIRNHCLSMGVKAFFLPLMFSYFVDDWVFFQNVEWQNLVDFESYFNLIYRSFYFLDLVIAVIGYLSTMRLLNAHIRWSEQTAGGWLFCLVCYMPFWQIIGRSYLNYQDGGVTWASWISSDTLLYEVWGCAILLVTALYVLSEAHFGLRFSNLTHRGVITHGFFRWTKHPAYLSKNLSWWIIDIPFIAVSWPLAVKNCLALLGINYIYYQRAKYEERCLSADPAYRDYAVFIDEKGMFSFLKRFSKTKNTNN